MPARARLARLSAILIFAVRLATGADAAATHVRNFDRVNDHLFRGGEPSLVGLQELGAMGVKLDIDLRGSGEGTQVEKEAAGKLGMKYVNIPLAQFSAPKNEQIEQVLAPLVRNDSGTIFVHCRRGKDRTGTVIACYRIQHDGWDNRRALEEAKAHGMSFAERAMRSFILHFTPLTLPQESLTATVTR